MTEDEALHVELVRAIELEDRESSLLTLDVERSIADGRPITIGLIT